MILLVTRILHTTHACNAELEAASFCAEFYKIHEVWETCLKSIVQGIEHEPNLGSKSNYNLVLPVYKTNYNLVVFEVGFLS